MHLTDDTARDAPDPIDTVIRPWLDRAGASWRSGPVSSIRNVCADSVAAALQTGLREDLERAADRVAAQRFHDRLRARGDVPSPGSRTAVDFFARLYDGAETAAQYPSLVRRLDCTVADRVDQVHEILTAFAEAIPGTDFPVPDGTLTGIRFHGDPHDGGRRVAVLEIDGRPTVVHKPRSTGPERFLQSVLDLLGPLQDQGELRLPRFAAGGTRSRPYGWHEYIDVVPLPTDDDAGARFHRRLGAWLAIVTALGGTDLHMENIRAHGDHPVPVDVETMLHPPTEPASAAAVTRALADGPLGTTMLPTITLSRESVAVLSDAGPRTVEGPTGRRIVHRGTDAFGIDAAPSVVEASDHRPLDPGTGRAVPLSGHIDDVVHGYHTATRRLRHIAPALHRLLDRARDVEFRRVVRPTAVYATFLDAACDPRYASDDAATERLFGLLPDSALGGPVEHEEERRALRRGDVPRFAMPAGADGVGGSAVDRAHRCLDELIRRAPASDEHVIRSALAGTEPRDDAVGTRPGVRDDLYRALVDPCADRSAARVQRRVDARAIRSGGTVVGTIDALPGADRAADPVLSVSDSTFYQAGGTLLLLTAIASRRADGVLRERHAAATATAIDAARRRRDEGPLSPCAFTGSVGDVWLLREAGVLDPAAATAAEELTLDLAARLDVAGWPRLDVVGGLAGGAVVLAELPRTASVDRVLHRMSDRLAAGLGDLDLRGAAHGVDGVAAALCRVDAALGRDDHRHLVEDVLASGPDPGRADGSWCSGWAGTVWAHTEIAAHTGRPDLAAALARRLPAPVERDDSICHGDAGVQLTAARVTDLTGRGATGVRRQAAASLDRTLNRGYLTGHPGHVGVTTFMTGVPGIAYARLAAARSVGDGVANPIALRPSAAARG